MALRDLVVSLQFVTNAGTLNEVDNKVNDLMKDLKKMGGVGDKSFDTVSRSATGTSKAVTKLDSTTQKTSSNASRGIERITSRIRDIGKEAAKLASKVGQSVSKMITHFDKFGQSVRNAGSRITKYITTPITGAITAAGTLTATLGLGRLIGMDEARAKLKGLGFEGEQVSQIMKDVENAVRGTTHTMAEGVSAAAGALAAGVQQGAELERYLKLVGDAATGSGRSFDEMAMIFNRIQAAGKLMTTELDMIEHGLPGFSLAMAKHLGVSAQEFRKMVSDGKVSTEQFLDVMETFAGGMSAAMADTWTGIMKNIRSNIGIIGQNLLEGLFEDGKRGMAEFLEILRSDELRTWAKETGQTIRETVQGIVERIRELKAQWDSLSPSVQENIKRFALFGTIAITALGPAVYILGIFISWFAKVASVIGFFGKTFWVVAKGVFRGSLLMARMFMFFGRTLWMISTWVFRGFMLLLRGLNLLRIAFITRLIPAVFAAIKAFATFSITLLMNPITWIVLAVVGLIAVIILLWRNWDTVSQWLSASWEWIKEKAIAIFAAIGDWIRDVFDRIVNWISTKWNEAVTWTSEKLSQIWQTIVGKFNSIVEGIREKMTNAKNTITEIWNSVMGFFRNINLFEIGKNIIQGLVNGIKHMTSSVIKAVSNIAGIIKERFLNFFSIRSPSRLMMEVGTDIGEGLKIGLDESTLRVRQSAQELAQTANPAPVYTPEHDSGQARSVVIHNVFSPETTINITGNMTQEQEREIEVNWKRKVKRWYEEFQREAQIREV